MPDIVLLLFGVTEVIDAVKEARAAALADQVAKDAADQAAKPPWLQRILDGNEFNRVRRSAYPYNELYVEGDKAGGYYILDSYDRNLGEIVSRKFTQLGDVQEQTALDYLKEIDTKYPPGTKIADVQVRHENSSASP